MNQSNEILSALDSTEFEREYLFKKPIAIPGAAIAYRQLIGWPLLLEVFQTNHNDCWLAKNGRLHELHDRTKLDFNSARAGFDVGYTVVIRHAELAHPKLKALAGEFEARFKQPIDIQLYGTPENEQGFDWHYDIEDVFVVQSFGSKEFRLRKNRNPLPESYSKIAKTISIEQEMEGPEIRCTLKAGDFLYIPSGFWHCAQALTPSFHLSVGVSFRSPH